ncbi:MAG: fibrillarin-like rRNA/tRNA 2'-O-methyltransferase [Promethearchaeota archaeon]
MEDKKRPGVFWAHMDAGAKRPATLNFVPGSTVYNEQIIIKGSSEFRIWDPYRSKLAAALLKGLEAFAFVPGASVLYLGASSGTTASHVSDLIGSEGRVYCVEFAPRMMRELVPVCAIRKNMIPIMADARYPESYIQIPEMVDVLYQDVAQPNQAKILVQNAKRFLRSGGTAYVAIKARSIDVAAKPTRIFSREEKTLAQSEFTVVDRFSLDPFSADHVFLSAIYGESE